MNAAFDAPRDFHYQLGKTIEGWSYVESCLCSLFIKVTQMYPPMGRKVFYSATGFRARTKMLRVAIETVNLADDGMRDFWTTAIDKADKYAAFRNLMVHGDIVFVDVKKSKHYKTHIILQGKHFWKADPEPNDAITYDQLKVADDNFRHLASCMMFVLGRDPKTTAEGPKECRELVALLPSSPHSSELSASDLARFSLLKSVSFER